MGLLDDLAGGLAGGSSAGQGGSNLANLVLEMLSSQQGGLSGLAQLFDQKGLGSLVSSWIATGQNLPVSAEQIQQVLGSDQVRAFAQKAGLSPETAGSTLADLLPGIVDQLTPGGRVPEGGDLMSSAAGLLQNLFGGKAGA